MRMTSLCKLLVLSLLASTAQAQLEFKGKIGRTLADSEEYWPEPVTAPEGAPNVLVWLIDDMGFGHAGTFGGLTPTPTLDRLANNGLRFNNFHTTALCSPTRAVINAGRNHHRIGMGSHSLTAMGFPGYDAHPPESAKGFGEILKRAGYGPPCSSASGTTPRSGSLPSPGPFDRWPSGDGFEHFYGFMSGDMNNFNPIMWVDHTPVQPNYDAPGYHVNEDMADTAIRWISMLRASAHKKPFVMFWATGAVHAPHQAPRNWRERFRGQFDMGYDAAREMILARQIEMGVVPKGTKLSPRDESIPAWSTLNDKEKALYARQMEAFAAQLAYSDYEFGRIVDYLDRIGELDNTLIIFTSDNGGSAEGGLHGTFNENGFFNGVPNIPYEVNSQFEEQWGNRVGVWHVTAGWTQAGNTPFQYYKQSAHRGGNADALIVSWPAGIPEKYNGQVREQYSHVIDIAPTILEAAGVEAPKVIDGVEQMSFDGIPLNYTFDDPDAESKRTVQYYELFGNRAIYADGWTAVTLHRQKRPWVLNAEGTLEDDVWELYNLEEDFSQSNNLADAESREARRAAGPVRGRGGEEQRLSSRRRRRAPAGGHAGAGRAAGRGAGLLPAGRDPRARVGGAADQEQVARADCRTGPARRQSRRHAGHGRWPDLGLWDVHPEQPPVLRLQLPRHRPDRDHVVRGRAARRVGSVDEVHQDRQFPGRCRDLHRWAQRR